jgi:hypothetical protein
MFSIGDAFSVLAGFIGSAEASPETRQARMQIRTSAYRLFFFFQVGFSIELSQWPYALVACGHWANCKVLLR